MHQPCNPPRPRRQLLALGLAALAAGTGLPAQAAPTVSLAGILGAKALLVIDGQTRALRPGDTATGGVKMVSVGQDEAVVEIDGQRTTLRLGEAPSLVGPGSGKGRRVVLMSDSSGHFRPDGTINGLRVQFIVDTGATSVAIGQPEAERLALPYRDGRPVVVSTANGQARAWGLQLESVRVGDVEVKGVDAVVVPQPMPYVLLGNSFLNRFQMTRTGDNMILDRRF